VTRSESRGVAATAGSTQAHEGACHCGAIGFVYRTAIAPADWNIRACQCGFCRSHATLTASDPAGSLEFTARDRDRLQRYRFGQRTADFLLCNRCGVYIGAVIQSGRGTFGIINARVLQSLDAPLPKPVEMTYESEQVAERTERREKRWTPVVRSEWLS
jgi:hypothetical protein